MPKIPIYERQVDTPIPNLQTPDVRVNIPEEAFGTGVARSVANLGRQVSNIGSMMAEKKEQDDKAKVLDRETQAKLELQNRLYSNDMQDVKNTDGTIYQQPVGLLNRQLKQANGVSQEYDKAYPEILNKYSSGLNKQQKETLTKLLDQSYLSNRDNVLRHEAIQIQNDRENTLNSSLALDIDSATRNPNSENITNTLRTGNGKIYQIYKNFDDSTKKLKMLEFGDKFIGSTVGSLLDTDNYQQAKKILDENKGNVSGQLYSNLDDKISKVKQIQTELSYSVNLFKKFGFDKAGADRFILADKNLSGDDKNRQLEKWNAFFNVKENERNVAENNTIDSLLANADELKKSQGANGYAKAIKIANLSSLPVDKRLNVLSQINRLFNVGDEQKTDLEAYMQVQKDIETGKITNGTEIIKNYGSRLTNGDIKHFINYISTWNKTPNGFNIAATANKILKENKIPVEDQGQFFDSVHDRVQALKLKNGKEPTADEKLKIALDAAKETLIQKRQMLGMDFLAKDAKAKKYKLPANAVFDDKTQSWRYKGKDGNWYIITEDDVK